MTDWSNDHNANSFDWTHLQGKHYWDGLRLQEQFLKGYKERTDSIISKLEDLKRKETIVLTMQKIEPSVPENFPKNYFLQLSYEDVVVTGNHKYVDFDENLID